jgi:DNA invertase Pin-like site-specific DNA recombinase
MIAFYFRVSTKQQTTDLQRRELTQYAALRGWTDIKIYEDVGVSGSKSSRPGLDILMSDARKRKFKTVVVWRFDRFARSSQHLITALEEFRSLGIDFISYSENIDTATPLGQAVFTIISALGQLERDIIRDRVRAGVATARAKGKRLGRPKTRDDERIGNLRLQGMSISAIATKLRVTKSAVQRGIKAKMPA